MREWAWPNRPGYSFVIPYLPFYTVMQVTIIRVIRLFALIQELFFRSSYRDPYVPARVMVQVDRV